MLNYVLNKNANILLQFCTYQEQFHLLYASYIEYKWHMDIYS